MEYDSYSNLYVHAFLIAQLVKNPPAAQKTLGWFLGWEDPLEKGTAIHCSITGLENFMGCIVHGVTKSWTGLHDFDVLYKISIIGAAEKQTIDEKVFWCFLNL